jgi:hypothetical protein
MVKMLEKKGLILRQPGQPRSIQVLLPEDEIPPWNNRKQARPPVRRTQRVAAVPAAPPAYLYVLAVFLAGGRPFDPDGPSYGAAGRRPRKKADGDVRTTKLDDLDLKPGRVFGYWFDFGDDWYHQVAVERIEQAIPTVTYPRVIKRVGKSPPQYC